MLLGKHWLNDGRGRKSGDAGSTVCFLGLVVFSLLVEEGSKVNVALGPEKEGRYFSFFHVVAAFPLTSNPGKKAVFGNFEEAEWTPLLQTKDVKAVFTEAIAGTSKTAVMYTMSCFFYRYCNHDFSI